VTIPLTDVRRAVLIAMLARCDNVHGKRTSFKRYALEEMICGAIFVADAAAQSVEQDFWAEVSDLLESGGMSAVRNLLKE
jgi:hypothetical protein